MRNLAILLLLACAACTSRADGPPSRSTTPPPAAGGAQAGTPAAAAPAGSLARIHALVGKAECTSDSQCQVLPVGAKACGGPTSYLAWSNAHTDAAEVQALAERYKAEQQASNENSGRISNCRAMVPPLAACRANTCQLVEALLVR